MPLDVDAALRQRLAAGLEERAQSKQGAKVDVQALAEDMVRRSVEDEVQRVVASIPRAKDGVDGKSLDAAELATQIAEAAARILAALPAPKDGVDGKDGTNGKDGRDGRDGKDAAKPRQYAFAVLRDEAGLINQVIATPL